MDAEKLKKDGIYIVREGGGVFKVKVQEVTKTTYVLSNLDSVADAYRVEKQRFAKSVIILEEIEQT